MLLKVRPGQAMEWDDVALHAAPPVTINVVRELQPEDTTPAMSVEEVRSLWAGRDPVRVETVAKGGFPVHLVREAVRMAQGIVSETLDLVFEPPWGPALMSEEARLELGFDI